MLNSICFCCCRNKHNLNLNLKKRTMELFVIQSLILLHFVQSITLDLRGLENSIFFFFLISGIHRWLSLISIVFFLFFVAVNSYSNLYLIRIFRFFEHAWRKNKLTYQIFVEVWEVRTSHERGQIWWSLNLAIEQYTVYYLFLPKARKIIKNIYVIFINIWYNKIS